jgi:hypothetical protein
VFCQEGKTQGRKQELRTHDFFVRENTRTLLEGLVRAAVGFLLVQVQVQVLAVGEGYDAVDVVVLGQLAVGLDRVHDGGRVGQSGGLEQYGIKVGPAPNELPQRPDQIAPHRTAHAAVVHGDEVLGGVQRFGHWYIFIIIRRRTQFFQRACVCVC